MSTTDRSLEETMCPHDIPESTLRKINEMQEFLFHVSAKSCSNCDLRWFSFPPTPDWCPPLQVLKDQDFGTSENRCSRCVPGSYLLEEWARAKLGANHPEISCLTDLEERCICQVCPVVSVFSSGTGQTEYTGHVSNVATRASEWIRSLPLDPSRINCLLVRRKTRGSHGGAERPPFKIRPARYPKPVNKSRSSNLTFNKKN